MTSVLFEKMLGYTNLDSEKGFLFFQNFLKTSGILEDLEKAGIQEGDTVRMYVPPKIPIFAMKQTSYGSTIFRFFSSLAGLYKTIFFPIT